jgi:tryptophanyl-tRNA synthetase
LAAKYADPSRQGPDGFGYGHAKQTLFELVLTEFAEPRARRAGLMADQGYIDQVLAQGAAKARSAARATVDRARQAVGL